MSKSAETIRASVTIVGAADAVSSDGMLDASLRALEVEFGAAWLYQTRTDRE